MKTHRPISTYVNWPVSLSLVVGSEKVERAREFEKKVVLETEHRGRSDNGCLGEDTPDSLLSAALHHIVRDQPDSPSDPQGPTFVAKNSETCVGSALYEET